MEPFVPLWAEPHPWVTTECKQMLLKMHRNPAMPVPLHLGRLYQLICLSGTFLPELFRWGFCLPRPQVNSPFCDLPSGPVAKTACCLCRGLGSIPGQGTRCHMPQLRPGTAKLKKKKKKKKAPSSRRPSMIHLKQRIRSPPPFTLSHTSHWILNSVTHPWNDTGRDLYGTSLPLPEEGKPYGRGPYGTSSRLNSQFWRPAEQKLRNAYETKLQIMNQRTPHHSRLPKQQRTQCKACLENGWTEFWIEKTLPSAILPLIVLNSWCLKVCMC